MAWLRNGRYHSPLNVRRSERKRNFCYDTLEENVIIGSNYSATENEEQVILFIALCF